MSAQQEPTSTRGLREDFRTTLTVRFRALKGAIGTTVGYENDALELRQGDNDPAGRELFAAHTDPMMVRERELVAAADDITPADGFQFSNRAEAQDEFMAWLATQIDRGILEPVERELIRDGEHYTARYIRSGYARGIDHADAKLNAQGVTVPEEDLQAVFNRGIHEEQLQDLYTRAFDNLETVTTDMQTAVRRELGTGLNQGWNPQKTARALNDRVDTSISDAERLARTEILHSHNSAAASRYQEYGVDQVEVLTYDPCSICQSLAAQNPWDVNEAPLVPERSHPNCVCSIAPKV